MLSLSRKKPKLLVVFKVSALAPGQTNVVYFIRKHHEQDHASDIKQYSFQKVMKTLHFNEKLCKQVPTKLKSMPALEPELKLFKVEAGAGAETNSYTPQH